MKLILETLQAFLCGGILCLIGQILICLLYTSDAADD